MTDLLPSVSVTYSVYQVRCAQIEHLHLFINLAACLVAHVILLKSLGLSKQPVPAINPPLQLLLAERIVLNMQIQRVFESRVEHKILL